jgi:hypothetical protein
MDFDECKFLDLTTSSQLIFYAASKGRMVMNAELGRKRSWPILKCCPSTFLEGMRVTTKMLRIAGVGCILLNFNVENVHLKLSNEFHVNMY